MHYAIRGKLTKKKGDVMHTVPTCHVRALHAVAIAACVLLAFLSFDGIAQAARMDVVPIESVTLTDQQFLAGREDGKPVTLAGELRLPRASNERFPLVILLHGSGGVGGYVMDWEQDLLAMGVATFIIDSFTSRGVTSTNNDQAQLGRLVQIEDAYRSLAILAKHPRIDPNRVMLMGFSRGGTATLYASLMRFQQAHAASSGLHFAAYASFYPDCSTTFREDDNISGPVRIFHGAADNYNPVAPCRAYAERLRAKRKDIEIIEYPGAAHVFDGRAFKPAVEMRQAQTTRNCRWEEVDAGQVLNAKTRQVFSWSDPCVERGATVAYNEKASSEVRKAVAEFVSATLRPAHAP